MSIAIATFDLASQLCAAPSVGEEPTMDLQPSQLSGFFA
jgi:hypothetical protein